MMPQQFSNAARQSVPFRSTVRNEVPVNSRVLLPFGWQYARRVSSEDYPFAEPSTLRYSSRIIRRVIVCSAGLVAWWNCVSADSSNGISQASSGTDAFTFVRLQYDSTGGLGESWYHYEGRDWQRWETDYPRAETNLMLRLTQLTSIRVNPEPIVLRLTDPGLFDHPFVFMSDVGWLRFTDEEKQRLARYLNTGGFLWIDDFWGQVEWQDMHANLSGLNDGWEWKEVPSEHPILHTFYQLKECPQVPARIFFEQTGLSWDPPQVHRRPCGGQAGVNEVRFMGLFDGGGRLLAVATHNTDIADGWEREGESREFFERFSVHSYAMGINILFYAMTH